MKKKIFYVELPTVVMRPTAIIAKDENELKVLSQQMVDKFKNAEYSYKIVKTKDKKNPQTIFHELGNDWQDDWKKHAS